MKRFILLTFALLFSVAGSDVLAQFGEPDLRKQQTPRNLYDEGYKSGFGFVFGINDFGVSFGGQYRRVVSRYTETLITLEIAGLRDPREQNYIDYFFGTRTVPDKYRRVITFPLNVGVKKRIFADQISDNFRIFVTAAAGPVLAYSYPYFDDTNNNGFRENLSDYGRIERINDVFTGWKDSESHLGWTGDLQIGIDFNSNFASLQSMQFGYTFNYFDNGLQIMQPNRPDLGPNGNPVFRDANGNETTSQFGTLDVEPDYEAKKFYGAAQISFIFGWMWN